MRIDTRVVAATKTHYRRANMPRCPAQNVRAHYDRNRSQCLASAILTSRLFLWRCRRTGTKRMRLGNGGSEANRNSPYRSHNGALSAYTRRRVRRFVNTVVRGRGVVFRVFWRARRAFCGVLLRIVRRGVIVDGQSGAGWCLNCDELGFELEFGRVRLVAVNAFGAAATQV